MWIARDKNGYLVLFTKDKPIRSLNDWQDKNSSETWVYIDGYYAPNLKWEDEPIEASLISKSVNEDKLDELANKEELIKNVPPGQGLIRKYGRDCFKVGYRTALNNKTIDL